MLGLKLEDITLKMEEAAARWGFSHFGWSPLTRPLSFEAYENWIAEGFHGDMHYLADHAPIKAEPQTKYPRAQSALVFAIPYFPHPAPVENRKLQEPRISLYAQGMDYHFWFKDKMKELCAELSQQFPSEEFLAFTDSSPILERDLARRAGLGWVGKNTCLIQPKKGSLFFIGEIYTSLELESHFAPVPDFCGTCTRCLDVCPTSALVEPRKLDARRCISYLTIESRKVPPLELRDQIGDWFFGCDLCQTVCPWNQKVFKGQLEVSPQRNLETNSRAALVADFRYLLKASGKQIARDFIGTPLARAGSFGLKRNALVVAANQGLYELEAEITDLVEHEKLGELASWALTKIKATAAVPSTDPVS